MAKINKEQRLYLDGMAFAYKIAAQQGIDSLEKEIKFRGMNNVPLNVNRYELTQIARERAKEELIVVATALAETVTQDMKLPPSVAMDFLKKFNDKVGVFRYDAEALGKAQAKLDSMYALNEMVKQFNEEE
jgi:hypothetical protein